MANPRDTLAKFPIEPTCDGISVAEAADERFRPLFENPPGAVIVETTLGAVVGQGHERRIFAWSESIFASDFEQGEIGPDLFHQVCKCERRDSAYRAGRSPSWITV
jgi:hypothetical protein